MDKVQELKLARKELADKAQAALAEAGDDITDEQLAEQEAIAEEIKGITAQIDRIEKARALGDFANAAISEPTEASPRPRPAVGQPGDIPGRNDDEPVRVEVGKVNLIDDPRGGYSNVPVGTPDPVGFVNFCLDVKTAERSGRPEKLEAYDNACMASGMQATAGDGLATNTGADGGYTVPTEYRNELWQLELEKAIVRPRAVPVPMSSPRVLFPKIDDTTHASTVFGGVLAYWTAEEAAATASKPAFGTVELATHKLTTLCYATEEMLKYSPISIASWLPTNMTAAMAWKEDGGFITGTGGAGQPTGFQTSGAGISITKEDEQVADTVVFKNITKMAARLWVRGSTNIAWVANQTLLPELYGLVQEYSGGGGTNVFLQDGKITAAQPLFLLGWPVLFTEHVPTLGDAKDLSLVNFDHYYVGNDVSGFTTEQSIHLKFDYGQTAYKVTTYTGGMSPWASAITPENGDTLSPFVTLGVRG